jgi:hypothetical protein
MRSLCSIALPLIGGVLLAGEGVVAVLGIWFPRENQMYREYYISHSRDCWLAPDTEAAVVRALARPEIDPPALDAQTACYVLAKGWNPTGPLAETGSDRTAWLELPALSGAKALDVTLANPSQTPLPVQVRFDGGAEAGVTLPPGQVATEVRLAVPPGAAGGLRIRLDKPGADGFMVLRLKWVE